MIPWNQAYRRIAESQREFATLFGKMFSQDDFRYYAYVIKFDTLLPALLAVDSAQPNTGNIAATRTNLGAPTTNIVPGPAANSTLNLAAGAVILGISSCARKLQRIANNGSNQAFTYGPTENSGARDLFALDLSYLDTSPITGQNPQPEISQNPNAPVNTAPPILADALMGGGDEDLCPARELWVAPGLGINVSVRSLVLPDLAAASPSQSAPNLSVHVVFHCMVPGIVTSAAA